MDVRLSLLQVYIADNAVAFCLIKASHRLLGAELERDAEAARSRLTLLYSTPDPLFGITQDDTAISLAA